MVLFLFYLVLVHLIRYTCSVSAIEERKSVEKWVKSCKDERVEDISYSERTASSNRYSLIIVLDSHKQQIS